MDEQTQQVQATVPLSIRKRIEKLAKEETRSVSAMTLILILQALPQRENGRRKQ
jgi:CopG-like RHH_1 or ribbon-helix-helix domain, RHH_5